MKIFVTGGLGVVGSHIVRILHAQGHQLFVFDAAEKPRNEWIAARLQILRPEIAIFRGRMEDPRMVDALSVAAECDLVIHAAASTGIPHSADDPNDDWNSNVEATRALLEIFRELKKAPTTVVFSSVKPYGLADLKIMSTKSRYALMRLGDLGVSESYPLEPDEPYAASKMAQSALVTAYARSYDMPLTTLRFSNLYGPAPCHGPRHGWLTWFCISAAIGRPLEVQGDGLQTRDMLFVTDICTAVMKAAASINKTRGKVFNVGGGKINTISVIEAAEALHSLVGIEIKRGPGRKHEDLLFVTDHSAFTTATGWRPSVAPKAGMAEILNWARENRESLTKLYESA